VRYRQRLIGTPARWSGGAFGTDEGTVRGSGLFQAARPRVRGYRNEASFLPRLNGSTARWAA